VRDGPDDRAGPDGSHGAQASRTARIVEVEAYIGEDDRASHARFGRTTRNAVMFGAPGVAYVYLVYGMHECLNVVTEPEGRPAAVLIRAVEPVDEHSAEAIRRARWARWHDRHPAAPPTEAAVEWERLRALPDARLASGPGLVAAGFGLSRSDTGRDLLDPMSPLRLEPGTAPARVTATPRIGIGYAPEPWRSRPWRFVDAGSHAASGARPRGSAS
jgi:DNA-3-methyladenine glycosylase